MLLGADTGFFVKLEEKNLEALRLWDGVIEGKEDLMISTLSINELLVHFYRRGKSEKAKELLALTRSLGNIEFISVTEEIAEKSAGFRHGLGLHTVDSIILASFKIRGCELLVTTDPAFQIANEQNIINVLFL